jgi:hypothetical protein
MSLVPSDVGLQEWAILLSLLALAGYELYVGFVSRRRPHSVARAAHAQIRVTWVRALASQAGSELLAVQTLRNSLMSATIVGSTAALALMGSISLGGPVIAHSGPALRGSGTTALLMVLLMTSLFGSLVASALAMRLFNHAGFIVSLPVGSPERNALNVVAEDYLRRAGHHYSRSLRFLFMVAPLIAGLFSPLLMPLGTVGLLSALVLFDRAPAVKSTQ